MQHATCRASRVVQYTEPTWDPLVDAVGEYLARGFMWMHEEELDDGTRIHAYKHRTTRRYLYLCESGTGYVATRCGRLAELRLDWAIERALLSWLIWGHATDEDREPIRETLERVQDGCPEVTW
jgi:hypothetical protein